VSRFRAAWCDASHTSSVSGPGAPPRYRDVINGDTLQVTFFGVRGSTPCQGDEVARYGGNTSCVSVAAPGHDPLLLDLGTGARYFGMACSADHPFRGTCLLSHAHWDHIQGLPFFPPILSAGG